MYLWKEGDINLTRKFNLHASIVTLVLVIIIGFAVNIYNGDSGQYVVKVNGQKVTLEEFKVYMKIAKKELENRAEIEYGANTKEKQDLWTGDFEGNDPSELVRKQVLDMVIEIKLYDQKLRENKLKLTKEEIDQLKKTLKKDEFIKKCNLQDKELDIYAKGLATTNKLLAYIMKDVKVKDTEVNDFLSKNLDLTQSYTINYILFLSKSNKDQTQDKDSEALQQAQQMHEKISSREDFSKLVKQYANDSSVKSLNGKLTFLRGEARDKELEDVVMNMAVGDISKLVKTETGYYIFSLDSIKQLNEKDMEKLKSNYKEQFTQQKRSQILDQYKEKWKKEAKIDKNNELLKSININNL